MKRLLTLLAVLGLLVGACGDEDDSAADETETEASESETDTETETETDSEDVEDASDDDYAAALAAELQAGGGFPGEPDQIECVAGVFIDSLGGADALRDVGVSPEDLAQSEDASDLAVELDEDQVAEDLVDGFEECDYDLIALLTESLGTDAPEGFEDCVREQVSNEDLAGVFARLMIDPSDEAAGGELVPKLEACAEPTPAG